MENQKENKPLTYDYKTVRVKRDMEAMYTDAYENLGWEVTSTTLADASMSYVNVSFKRDRKIVNKTELNKLQDEIDEVLTNIEKTKSKKANAGVVEGVSTGVVGALVFGGGMSMSMVLEGIGFLIGGIALGVVGIGVMFLGWLVHNKVQKKKLTKLEPIYQEQLDKLSELCEQANKLLK